MGFSDAFGGWDQKVEAFRLHELSTSAIALAAESVMAGTGRVARRPICRPRGPRISFFRTLLIEVVSGKHLVATADFA